tara:strand:- start:1402 stop:1755 length:354 start_codon:yes stop_codon:yes gene_type:complete
MTTALPQQSAPPMRLLPKKSRLAIETMIELTQQTLDVFEAETNGLAMNAHVELLEIMRNKQEINALYQQAAREFMARQEELLSQNPRRTQELITLQKKLSEAIKLNMSILERINRDK